MPNRGKLRGKATGAVPCSRPNTRARDSDTGGPSAPNAEGSKTRKPGRPKRKAPRLVLSSDSDSDSITKFDVSKKVKRANQEPCKVMAGAKKDTIIESANAGSATSEDSTASSKDRDRVKVGKQSSEEILRQLKRYQDELARRDKEVALSQGTNITATSDCVYDSKKNTGTEPIVFQCNANDSTEVSEVIITTTDENVVPKVDEKKEILEKDEVRQQFPSTENADESLSKAMSTDATQMVTLPKNPSLPDSISACLPNQIDPVTPEIPLLMECDEDSVGEVEKGEIGDNEKDNVEEVLFPNDSQTYDFEELHATEDTLHMQSADDLQESSSLQAHRDLPLPITLVLVKNAEQAVENEEQSHNNTVKNVIPATGVLAMPCTSGSSVVGLAKEHPIDLTSQKCVQEETLSTMDVESASTQKESKESNQSKKKASKDNELVLASPWESAPFQRMKKRCEFLVIENKRLKELLPMESEPYVRLKAEFDSLQALNKKLLAEIDMLRNRHRRNNDELFRNASMLKSCTTDARSIAQKIITRHWAEQRESGWYMFGRYKVSKEDVLLLIDACDEMESQFFPYLAELVYGLQYCLTHVVVGHENTDGMEPVSCNAMLNFTIEHFEGTTREAIIQHYGTYRYNHKHQKPGSQVKTVQEILQTQKGIHAEVPDVAAQKPADDVILLD